MNLGARFLAWYPALEAEVLATASPEYLDSLARRNRCTDSLPSISLPSNETGTAGDVDEVGERAAPAALTPTLSHLPDIFAMGTKVVLVGLERRAHLNSNVTRSVELDGLKQGLGQTLQYAGPTATAGGHIRLRR